MHPSRFCARAATYAFPWSRDMCRTSRQMRRSIDTTYSLAPIPHPRCRPCSPFGQTVGCLSHGRCPAKGVPNIGPLCARLQCRGSPLPWSRPNEPHPRSTSMASSRSTICHATVAASRICGSELHLTGSRGSLKVVDFLVLAVGRGRAGRSVSTCRWRRATAAGRPRR